MQVRECHENIVVNVFLCLQIEPYAEYSGHRICSRRPGLLRKVQRATPTLMKTRQPVYHEGLPTSLMKLPVTSQQGNSILFNHISSLNKTQPCKATYTARIKIIKLINLHFFSYLHYFFPSHLIYFLSLSLGSHTQTSPLPRPQQTGKPTEHPRTAVKSAGTSS
jgi:hypothetical protein